MRAQLALHAWQFRDVVKELVMCRILPTRCSWLQPQRVANTSLLWHGVTSLHLPEACVCCNGTPAFLQSQPAGIHSQNVILALTPKSYATQQYEQVWCV